MQCSNSHIHTFKNVVYHIVRNIMQFKCFLMLIMGIGWNVNHEQKQLNCIFFMFKFTIMKTFKEADEIFILTNKGLTKTKVAKYYSKVNNPNNILSLCTDEINTYNVKPDCRIAFGKGVYLSTDVYLLDGVVKSDLATIQSKIKRLQEEESELKNFVSLLENSDFCKI